MMGDYLENLEWIEEAFREEIRWPHPAPPLWPGLADQAQARWDAGDYLGWLYLHRREDRLDAAASAVGRVSAADLAVLVHAAWTESDAGLYRRHDLIRALFERSKPMLAMTDAERELLDSLPETVMVYRGCHDFNMAGFSWSIDEATARWFTTYRPLTGYAARVIAGEVSKPDVVMACLERDERELVVDPRSVRNVTAMQPS